VPEAYELITRIAGKGVLTNLLQPYALTRMTDDGMPSQARKHMEPDAVAPALTALASEDCRLNGEYIVTGGGRLRRASVVEWDTVWLPNEPDLSPGQLEALHRWRPGPGVTDNGRNLAAYGRVGRKT